MTYNCYFCGDIICKYRMDLGDTIIRENHAGEEIMICDDCARNMAREFIER